MKKDNITRIDRMSTSDTNNYEHVFSERFMQRKQEMLDRVRQEDLEKKTTHKKYPKAVVAAILLLCMISIGVPVAATAIAYLNGNTKNDFKEEIGVTLNDISNQMPDTTPNTSAKASDEEQLNSNVIEGVDINVLDISRVNNEISFTVQLTFEDDITQWVSQYYDYQLTYGTIMTSELFTSTSVHFDGVNLDSNYLDFDTPNPISTVYKIISHDEHTLNLEIELTDLSDEEKIFDGRHTFDLFFLDINAGDKVCEGFWTYTHEFDSNKYDNTELITQPIELNAKTSATYDPDTLSITSYALTQNGVSFYGIRKCVLFHSDEWYEDETNNQYPQTFASARLHAEDNLGNHYLFYARSLHTIEYSEENEDVEIEQRVVFDLYNDLALYNQEDVSYKAELDPNATHLTVYIEEEVNDAEYALDNSPTYYRAISDSVTIPLTKIQN